MLREEKFIITNDFHKKQCMDQFLESFRTAEEEKRTFIPLMDYILNVVRIVYLNE